MGIYSRIPNPLLFKSGLQIRTNVAEYQRENLPHNN